MRPVKNNLNILNYIIILLAIGSCQDKSIHQINYKSINSLTPKYEFNSVINYYFQKTKDGGMASTSYSYVSEHERLIKSLIRKDSIDMISEKMLSEIKDNYKSENAINYIIAESKNHDIIMFNEDHAIPQHRNFVSQLLPELYSNGYINLGLEGLSNGINYEREIEENGYPSTYHGPYIKEPEYGNLIRKARALGINVFGYSGAGEEASAKNILDYMNSDDKKGKTIVLSGWDHIKEGHTGTYWEYAIAGKIKELSGLDPLTINQTQYFEKAKKIYEDSLYQALSFTEPTVLIDVSNQSIDLESDPGWYDLFVFHPRTKFVKGIPDWILKNKNISKFEIPKVNINCPCKVLLFEIGDDVEIAVPTYIVEIPKLTETVNMPTAKHTNYSIVVANNDIAYLIE